MRGNEKAPVSVCKTLNEAETEKSGTPISDIDIIMPERGMQAKIAALLPRGEENAIPAKKLAAIVGAPSVRALQTMISRECAATDALILSTAKHGGGYYLPAPGAAGREEIQRYIGTLTARARHTFLRLRAARRALARIDGQAGIEEVDVDGRT